MASEWNSLEIAKLLTSCATPLIVGCFGIYIHRVTKRFEQSQWRNQKLVEKRLLIYDSLAPQFNELLCYFTYVGRWKDVDPATIIAMKRKMDKEIYIAQPLFTSAFFSTSIEFIGLCFATYQGWGVDARLRTQYKRRADFHPKWNEKWQEYFADDSSDPQDIRDAYHHVMGLFAVELGICDASPEICSGEPSESIQ